MHTDKSHEDAFHVPRWVDVLGGFINHRQGLWIRMGGLETRLLSDEIADIPIEQPIYVSGIARSGSTILLEVLSQFEQVVTHQYKDYPPVFTPYFWNWFFDRMAKRGAEAVERAHRDGIMVTPESPEAFEEVLWMAFFPNLHETSTSSVLDHRTSNAAFERFYRDHIRKLLRVRGGNRYLSKGNYNVTRLEYLLKLFPDARFVIPVREPAWHIASLMKQHKLFCDGEQRNPRALQHMRRVGHFEFGLDRRPINAGDRACIARIVALWERGDDIEGWAHYWNHVYGYIAERLDGNARLRDAAMTVRFEDLCQAPKETLKTVLDHCRLPASDDLVDRLAERIRFPSYYQPQFSEKELDLIGRITRTTAERFGYTEPLANTAHNPVSNGSACSQRT